MALAGPPRNHEIGAAAKAIFTPVRRMRPRRIPLVPRRVYHQYQNTGGDPGKGAKTMQESRQPSGSATRWGPLFGGRARDWAETWEGPEGWRIPVYEYILDRLRIGAGSRVLDCGCGAGRFARMAVDRGASVAGVDAAEGLLEI